MWFLRFCVLLPDQNSFDSHHRLQGERRSAEQFIRKAKIILELYYQKSTADHQTVWDHNSAKVLSSSSDE